tara:strand:+ start:92 stop:418 length:327 start_codon:yes stop_codon:yes gene_type:complete
MYKIIIYFVLILFTLNACGGTWDSVKRGITGQKRNSTDEFLVKKKDPLTLPPDFENLPKPSEGLTENEELEISSFEKSFTENESQEEGEGNVTSSDAERSILKKIRRK